MNKRSSGESRRSSASQDTNSNSGTFVNREKSSDEADVSGDHASLLSRSRSRANRANLYAEQDAENMRSAEREASRMHEKSADEQGNGQLLDQREEDGDSFDKIADHPAHLPASQRVAKPIKRPLTTLGKVFKWVHNFSMLTRWILYITPLTLILLVPLLVGAIYHPGGRVFSVAGVSLQWFAIWWEIIWLTLWAAKLAAKLVPLIIGPLFSVFTNSYKKWRDLCIALEVALTLFFWWLAVYISFLPIVTNHQVGSYVGTRQEWQTTLNRIVLTVFIATCLNLIEKLLIQLVAIGFHQRQYEDRIVLNKFQIASLTKLYRHSRETERLTVDNDDPSANLPSGARTPNQALTMVGRVVQKTARDAMGKVTGEIAGRRMEHSNAPRQVVLSLLDSTSGAQTLARRLFASYHAIQDKADEDFIRRDEMRDAFSEDEEADAAFAMFDKDFNGDVTCEEMEIACVEISKERKSITSSLKDLDHAVSKLDDICVVIVAIIVILIFISLISRSFSGVLTSAGTTILGLSWLFSQLAQEFLASIVFVFVKHPFDVGDRVDILMNGTVQSLIVKEISLMATEFRLLDGRIVQAPNNVLNQLFILNMRRTGGVAEGVPTTLRFGVSIEKIDALRQSMVEFVRSEPRDYKPDILSELTDIPNLQSVKFTLVFFHKQNWQNEGLRIGRRNKFMCALMTNMQRLGMESSIYNGPGGAAETPMFLQYIQAPTTSSMSAGSSAAPVATGSLNPQFDPLTSNEAQNAQINAVLGESDTEEAIDDRQYSDVPAYRHEIAGRRSSLQSSSVLRRRVARPSGIAAHMQRVDYSLGATDFAQSNTNEFFEESQERGLQAVLEVAEEHEDRAQQERYEREKKERKSESRARSPSNSSVLQRTNTNMSMRSRTGGRLNRFKLMPSRSRVSRDGRRSGEYDEEYNLEQIPSGGTLDSRRSTASRTIDGVLSHNVRNTQRRDMSPTAQFARDMSVIPEDRETSPEVTRLRRGNTDMSFGQEEVLNVTPASFATPSEHVDVQPPVIMHTSPSPAPTKERRS